MICASAWSIRKTHMRAADGLVIGESVSRMIQAGARHASVPERAVTLDRRAYELAAVRGN
jgi:hypothetical protein